MLLHLKKSFEAGRAASIHPSISDYASSINNTSLPFPMLYLADIHVFKQQTNSLLSKNKLHLSLLNRKTKQFPTIDADIIILSEKMSQMISII